MDTNPFITIGIASYNYAEYLQKAFEAIKAQTFTDYEILYIDDNSTDNSVKIIEGFIKDNPQIRIRLIRNEKNMGLLYSKTQIIKNALGKYLMLCDADDYMLQGCLEETAKAAKEQDADRVIVQVKDITPEGKVLQIQDFAKKPSPWLWNLHHGCLYRTSIFQENNIGIEFYPDDVYLTTYFNEFVNTTAWVAKPLYCWVVHQDSFSRQTSNAKEKFYKEFETVLNFTEIQAKKLQSQSPDIASIIELLQIKYFYLCIYHCSRNFSYREKVEFYKTLSEILKAKKPNYLKNKMIKSRNKCGLRPYAYKIIRLSMALEKTHLFIVALFYYHIIGKFIYFDM